MAVNAVKELQVYTTHLEVEHEHNDILVTLRSVDLAEIVGQVKLEDLLDNVELDRIQDYITNRIKEDSE